MDSQFEPSNSGAQIDPLDMTDGDFALTIVRMITSVAGELGGLANELLPSATERQHRRAIESLRRLVAELKDQVDELAWRQALMHEEFDAAITRAYRAAIETSAEEKREFIWIGLINGFVRTGGDPARDRLQRLVAKYDLEHFQILREMQRHMSGESNMLAFETSSAGKTLVGLLERDREELLAYLQEFHSDGLLMVFEQPFLREASNGGYVTTQKTVLWRPDADRLLTFIEDPRSATSAESQAVRGE
ncbi:hypothetical protein [Rathayibacter tanaceti]|uniref:Uncharacterized protein n=2 Tax=Rathayibacter tanaceti TaxID=1671680 RepID=A0A166HD55_9MICO|nr:hypothetical protein [Rathayibacter tanaceti]KZX20386.1 hypothetical protein ACH61_02492 [Rathayibacter tanaceti]QHC54831.1 hypothetical protein GSU10_03675 [Rathayibacter tanaceti]TCO37338.1 hypothetical protein EV639_1043 [Rathayibacter tanaceti]